MLLLTVNVSIPNEMNIQEMGKQEKWEEKNNIDLQDCFKKLLCGETSCMAVFFLLFHSSIYYAKETAGLERAHFSRQSKLVIKCTGGSEIRLSITALIIM